MEFRFLTQQNQLLKINSIKNKLCNKAMSEEKELTEKIEDLLFQNVNVSSQQVQGGNHQSRSLQKSIALQNRDSLALFHRHSIEKGIPISKNMLSQDMYPKEESHSQKSSEEKQQAFQENHQNQLMIPQVSEQWLVEELSFSNTSKRKKAPQNTKNVLRNFGNAQNQYALYNKDAIKLVEQEISDPQSFRQWIRTLKLQNFEGFKEVWTEDNDNNKLYRRIYKKLCWKFYSEAAIPYVLTSRMRDLKTKLSHLKYVYRFLQGLKNPEEFTYFKKVEK